MPCLNDFNGSLGSKTFYWRDRYIIEKERETNRDSIR